MKTSNLTPAQVYAVEQEIGVSQSGWAILQQHKPRMLQEAIDKIAGCEKLASAQLKKLLAHYCELAKNDGINPDMEPIVIETRKLLKEIAQ